MWVIDLLKSWIWIIKYGLKAILLDHPYLSIGSAIATLLALIGLLIKLINDGDR